MTPDAYDSPGPRDPLADGYAGLVMALDPVLDHGAGLHEIRIETRHTDLLARLDRLVDTESGLAAIVRPRREEPPRGIPPALTPARQLELRRHPLVRSGQLTEQALRLLLVLRPVHLALLQLEEAERTAPDLPGVMTIRANLAGAAESAGRPGLDNGSGVPGRLQRAVQLTDALLRNAPLPPRHRLRRLILLLAQEVVAPLDRSLHRIVRSLVLTGATPTASALTDYLALDRAPAAERHPVLTRALSTAQSRIRNMDVVLGALLETADHRGLCSSLLNGLLDDVTGADLTDLSLTPSELTGLQWSLATTRWPPAVDVPALIGRSAELAPGVYKVLPPGSLTDDWVLV